MAASAFFTHGYTSNKHMFSFLKLLKLIKFLKKLKQYIFTIILFYFFMCDELPFINTTRTQKTLKPSKNLSIPRMDEKKLHTWEFQLKGINRNMICKLLQKRPIGKATECSKQLRHIAIEKDIFWELKRCNFQISLNYIKLVIPKILFILVLWNFNFYFKFMWPPPTKLPPPPLHQNKNFWPPSKDFSKIFTPAPSRLANPAQGIRFLWVLQTKT